MTRSLAERAKAYIEENGGTRLLIGLAALCSIALFYLIALVGEKVSEKAIEVAALKAEVASLRSLGSADEMGQRLNAYRQALSSYESRVIEAETVGLISAEIQSLIRAGAQKAGLDSVQLEVAVDDELSKGELIVLRIDVRAVEKKDGAFASFIADIISGKTAYYVSTVSWDRRSGRTAIQFECVGRIKEPRT